MKYTVRRTAQFKREYKLMLKRGYDIDKLQDVVTMLADGRPLPQRYDDHALRGKYEGSRECHIEPDWLLIYQIVRETLILKLMHTGTHSDLF